MLVWGLTLETPGRNHTGDLISWVAHSCTPSPSCTSTSNPGDGRHLKVIFTFVLTYVLGSASDNIRSFGRKIYFVWFIPSFHTMNTHQTKTSNS